MSFLWQVHSLRTSWLLNYSDLCTWIESKLLSPRSLRNLSRKLNSLLVRCRILYSCIYQQIPKNKRFKQRQRYWTYWACEIQKINCAIVKLLELELNPIDLARLLHQCFTCPWNELIISSIKFLLFCKRWLDLLLQWFYICFGWFCFIWSSHFILFITFY